ncbi:hypothetical protein IRJ41_002908, partial [Triplophysa rosa]
HVRGSKERMPCSRVFRCGARANESYCSSSGHPLFTPYKFTSLLRNLLQRYAKQAGVAVRILILLANSTSTDGYICSTIMMLVLLSESYACLVLSRG